jgi:hypothetical protein
MAIQNSNKKSNTQNGVTFSKPAKKKDPEKVTAQWMEDRTTSLHCWEDDHSDQLVAAIRAFFLTHTLDPLTGEVHTVH